MSLLTDNPVLEYVYKEAQNHDIEYKAKNFWQNYLIQEFPISRNFTVNSEVSPDGNSRARLDLSVGQVRGQKPYQIEPTLLFVEVKRKGTGEVRKAEEQLRKGAERYLEKNNETLVYGITAWGTKARTWIIERTSDGYRTKPYTGADIEAHKGSYFDANTDEAWYISCFTATIKGDPLPDKPDSLSQLYYSLENKDFIYIVE
ncbi:hypothetical protein V8C37DRAFT_259422 [Trichoderma ceciliae]